MRATAIEMLRDDPPAAIAKLRARVAKGKAKALIDEAIATLKPAEPTAVADSGLLEQLVAIWNVTYRPDVADLIDIAATQLPRSLTASPEIREQLNELALRFPRSASGTSR